MNTGLVRESGAHQGTPGPTTPARIHSGNQIRRATSGGLLLGSTHLGACRTIARLASGRDFDQVLEAPCTGVKRNNLTAASANPAQTANAVARSSVSFAGTTFLSQWSKHSTSGVSAASTSKMPARTWKTRFDISLRISGSRQSCKSELKNRSNARPRFIKKQEVLPQIAQPYRGRPPPAAAKANRQRAAGAEL